MQVPSNHPTSDAPNELQAALCDTSCEGFPKLSGTFLGVPRIRTVVFWGPDWVPAILGNYNLKVVIFVSGFH